MKTQIIYLDPHDDVTSVREKVTWSKAQRILLVWPGRSRVLTSRLDLQLIQRHAASRNAQLGIVTLDPDVQAHADRLGIPRFEDLRTLPESGWRRRSKTASHGRRREPTGDPDLREMHPGKSSSQKEISTPLRLGIFSLALLATVATMTVLLPSAEISVEPVQPSKQESFIFTISDESDPGTLNIELSEVREDRVRVSDKIRVTTSGATSEPGEYAGGQVEFTNLTDEPVFIPAQSTVREPDSDQLYFITQTPIRLPGEVGASDSVSIVASMPGPIGNVAPGNISAVDGSLGLVVEVNNIDPTTGGSVVARNAVALTDISRARQQLHQKLMEQSEELIIANLLPEEQLLKESLSIIEILDEKYDREIGEPADTLELETSIVAHAYIVNIEILTEKIRNLIISGGNTATHIVPQTLKIDSIDFDELSDENELAITVMASCQTYQPIDREEVIARLRGLRPDVARSRLQVEYSQVDFGIQIYPSWYPWLPFFEGQFNLRYAWEEIP